MGKRPSASAGVRSRMRRRGVWRFIRAFQDRVGRCAEQGNQTLRTDSSRARPGAIFRPYGAGGRGGGSPWLAPWATFFRRSAAGGRGRVYPWLAPWATFFRRSAAGEGRLLLGRVFAQGY